MTFTSNWKPSRTARKKETLKERADKRLEEEREKRKVRRRDRRCRFPLCGCAKLKLRLEVSHDFHKGMGSKDGVSIADLMVYLCEHRHQHGAISRHAGTMRARYLTPDQYAGPVAWDVDLATLERHVGPRPDLRRLANTGTGFLEVAREADVQKLEPLLPWQRALLEQLATMDL